VILAQVAGIPSDQITEILKLGFPWPVIVLLCYYLVKKDKEIAELTTLRVSELKEVGAALQSNTQMMATWVAANDTRTRALEKTTEAQRLEAEALLSNTESLNGLKDMVNKAMESNVRMRETVAELSAKIK
jgi:hypothetical protein